MVKQIASAAKGSNGAMIVGGGSAVAVGILEMLDWLWETGLHYQEPTLYDFIMQDPIQNGISWMVITICAWVSRATKRS